jgi:hypothetical protein
MLQGDIVSSASRPSFEDLRNVVRHIDGLRCQDLNKGANLTCQPYSIAPSDQILSILHAAMTDGKNVLSQKETRLILWTICDSRVQTLAVSWAVQLLPVVFPAKNYWREAFLAIAEAATSWYNEEPWTQEPS